MVVGLAGMVLAVTGGSKNWRKDVEGSVARGKERPGREKK